MSGYLTLAFASSDLIVICDSSCLFFRMGTRVYIGRLPYQAREKDVERFFRGYGRINDIMLKNGYGFVVSISIYIPLGFF